MKKKEISEKVARKSVGYILDTLFKDYISIYKTDCIDDCAQDCPGHIFLTSLCYSPITGEKVKVLTDLTVLQPLQIFGIAVPDDFITDKNIDELYESIIKSNIAIRKVATSQQLEIQANTEEV